MNPYILTRSGTKVDLLAPDPGALRVDDIVHSLSHICRFTGHTPGHYSVAEHSIAVARRVRELGGSDIAVKTALLHDAEESFIGDVSTPLKLAMRDPLGESTYLAISTRFRHALAVRFGVSATPLVFVVRADHEVTMSEGVAIFGEAWPGVDELGPRYHPRYLSPKLAADLYRDMLEIHGVV